MTDPIGRCIEGFGLEPIDLERLDQVASLRSRFDRKYVLSPADGLDFLGALLGGHPQPWNVLEVSHRQQFEYRSLYLDHSRALFLAHVRGRRRRFKVRIRSYGEASSSVLEVKSKDGRGHTVKFRCEREGCSPALSNEERQWIDATLGSLDFSPCADVLAPSAEVRYRRMTLVDARAHERITIDLGVTAAWPGHNGSVPVVGEALVIEVKSNHVRTPPVAIMQQLGLRSVPMSKYCAGLSALDPDMDQRVRRTVLRELERRAQRRARNLEATR